MNTRLPVPSLSILRLSRRMLPEGTAEHAIRIFIIKIFLLGFVTQAVSTWLAVVYEILFRLLGPRKPSSRTSNADRCPVPNIVSNCPLRGIAQGSGCRSTDSPTTSPSGARILVLGHPIFVPGRLRRSPPSDRRHPAPSIYVFTARGLIDIVVRRLAYLRSGVCHRSVSAEGGGSVHPSI